MIARNYTAHLHCDGEHPDWARPDIEGIGETWAQARRQVQRLGWKVTRNRGNGEQAFCPDCNRKPTHPKPGADK